jgi:hypothetical protein
MSSDSSLADDDQPERDVDDEIGVDEDAGDDAETALSDRERLEGELARLESENERLREEYVRSKQTQYRRTALALIAVGVLAAIGGVLAASVRTVLFALAGTGIFLGILTYYLAPEQFLAASIGREVYGAMADNEASIVAELGLSESWVYLQSGDNGTVRLYVPQNESTPLPDEDELDETFVVDGGRGLALRPTGAPLFEEFERALSGSLASTPDALASQLTDALVEQFEIVESIEQSTSGDADSGQLTVGVVESAYGPLEQFDHPVASFLGTGLARGLDVPVAVDIEQEGNERVDAVVVCRWPYSTETDTDEE